jgi:septum site-determining protein MinC
MGEAVNFKGNKDGIVLLLDLSIEFEALCQMIVQKLWNSRSFLGEHTALIVNSGQIALDSGQQLALIVLLQSLGHEVKYFVPEAEVEQEPKKAEKAEQPSSSVAALAQKKEAEPQQQEDTSNKLPAGLGDAVHYLAEGALVVRKNVRSGQNISYDGTLVVFGDVNAGAELVATGHILVLGTLRGVAHAGCRGNKQAIVYANHLNSLQLRIADLIARAPDGESNERHVPEIARIIDNQLVIEEV